MYVTNHTTLTTGDKVGKGVGSFVGNGVGPIRVGLKVVGLSVGWGVVGPDPVGLLVVGLSVGPNVSTTSRVAQKGTRQYSHSTSGSVVRHHGFPPPGLRQKLDIKSQTGQACAEYSCVWGVWAAQAWHSNPLSVWEMVPR